MMSKLAFQLTAAWRTCPALAGGYYRGGGDKSRKTQEMTLLRHIDIHPTGKHVLECDGNVRSMIEVDEVLNHIEKGKNRMMKQYLYCPVRY